MSIDAATVRENLDRIHQRIAAAGGDPEQVRVLAVTKGFDVEVARAAVETGFRALGENYAQELAGKAEVLPEVEWHFIGRLQSNKVKLVAGAVSCWQSVDRASLVDEIAKRAPGARILVQVNLAGEDQKGGCDRSAVPDLVDRAREAGLDVAGLMAVGVDGDDDATRRVFEGVAELAVEHGLDERSIGMTADLELAVRSGTTMVRVGRALFGERSR